MVEDLSGAKVREEVVGGGASDQGWWDAVSCERRLGHMVLRLDSCCEENENCKALDLKRTLLYHITNDVTNTPLGVQPLIVLLK